MSKPKKQKLAGMPGKWIRIEDGQLLAVGDFCPRVGRFWTTPDNDCFGPGVAWFRPYDEAAKRALDEWRAAA